MARIREVVPSTQKIRPHKAEDEVSCQYKVIEDTDGSPWFICPRSVRTSENRSRRAVNRCS